MFWSPYEPKTTTSKRGRVRKLTPKAEVLAEAVSVCAKMEVQRWIQESSFALSCMGSERAVEAIRNQMKQFTLNPSWTLLA